MSRTVNDLILLDAVLYGTTDTDASRTRPIRLGRPACYWSGIDNKVRAVLDKVVDKLSSSGIEIVDIDLPELMDLNSRCAGVIVGYETFETIPRFLDQHGSTLSLSDILHQVASPDVAQIFEFLYAARSASKYEEALTVDRPRLQRLFAHYFETYDIEQMPLFLHPR